MIRTRAFRLTALSTLALILGVVLVRDVVSPAPSDALAYTECPFNRSPRVVMTSGLAAEDTMPVRMHEEVHREQCRLLGPLRYRLKNLTTTGKLSMEAPGYCMGARARLRRGDDRAVTRERMFDDANAAFAGSADSAKVNAALRASCPEISLFPLARFLQ